MAKRKTNETKEERKERKRLKKEAKKKENSSKRSQEASQNDDIVEDKQKRTAAVSPLYHTKRLRLAVSLLPSRLGSVKKNVEDAMRGFLLKYTAGLGGILLAFEDLVVLDDAKGRILEELPHVHYEVECSALLFCPVAGEELKGAVVESFHSHLSVMVFQYFNASITSRNLQKSGFEFDEQEGSWVHSGSGAALGKGQQLRFAIDKVHEAGGIVSLEGRDPRL